MGPTQIPSSFSILINLPSPIPNHHLRHESPTIVIEKYLWPPFQVCIPAFKTFNLFLPCMLKDQNKTKIKNKPYLKIES